MKQREYIRSFSDHIAGSEGLLPEQLNRTATLRFRRSGAVQVRFNCRSIYRILIGVKTRNFNV